MIFASAIIAEREKETKVGIIAFRAMNDDEALEIAIKHCKKKFTDYDNHRAIIIKIDNHLILNEITRYGQTR